MRSLNLTAAYFSNYFRFTYYWGKANFCLAGPGKD